MTSPWPSDYEAGPDDPAADTEVEMADVETSIESADADALSPAALDVLTDHLRAVERARFVGSIALFLLLWALAVWLLR